ncbi:MAG: helix-turn-helix transcriptional regulator, partial [Oscillospiraceae bacterium]|nr:helix-turn-helix transcriptional regulator [Oscillospiraceae bacterium]
MDAINKEKFGEFISRLRKEKGLTQQELADRLFISNKAVSKWERGQSLPDIDLLTPLSDILGVSVAELLKGEPITGAAMDSGEVETLVSQALQLSGAEEENKRGRTRKRWQTLWVRSLVVSLLEAGFL